MISIGLARGDRGQGHGPKRARERENGDAKNGRGIGNKEREGGGGGGRERPDGSERDGVSQPEECLSWQRRGSGTGSVQSSQVSPREGDILLRGLHVPRSFGVLRRAHRGPVASRYSSLTLYSRTLASSVPSPIASAVARFHPPITPTPRQARARTRTRCVAREIAPRSTSPSSERRIVIA